jgi:hypothetical protein
MEVPEQSFVLRTGLGARNLEPCFSSHRIECYKRKVTYAVIAALFGIAVAVAVVVWDRFYKAPFRPKKLFETIFFLE